MDAPYKPLVMMHHATLMNKEQMDEKELKPEYWYVSI